MYGSSEIRCPAGLPIVHSLLTTGRPRQLLRYQNGPVNGKCKQNHVPQGSIWGRGILIEYLRFWGIELSVFGSAVGVCSVCSSSGAPYSHVADKKGPLCTQDQKIDRQNRQSLGSPAPTLPPWYPPHPSPRICFKAIPEGPHIQPLGNWDHNSFYSMVFWGLIP